MNRSVLNPPEDIAVDAIISVLNTAHIELGPRQTPSKLANSCNEFCAKSLVSLHKLQCPLVKTCEQYISDTIRSKWNLASIFKYYIRYMESSTDEAARYLYYEAVFSKPTNAYPIPQATVSVFFRVEDKKAADVETVPMMKFRIDGHHTDHDVRHVMLTADWIFAVLKMKTKFFKRIETLNVF